MALRRGLRRLRRWLGWSLLATVILAALVVALASRFLPLLARHPDVVADWLAGQIGVPVEVARVEASWNRAGPELALAGLRIGLAPDVLDIGQARVQVNVYSGLWPGMPLTELRLHGPELELRRLADGRWRLDGFGCSPAGTAQVSQFEQLDRFGAIEVSNARLHFHDAIEARDFSLPRISARLLHRHGRIELGALLHSATGAQLRLAAELSPDFRSGTLFGEGIGQDWAALLQGWSVQGIELAQARGDVRAWIDLRDAHVVDAQIEMKLAALALRATERSASAEDSAQTGVAFGSWDLVASLMRADDGGWQVAVPRWQVRSGAATAASVAPEELLRNGLASWAPQGLLRAQAERVAIGPLLQMALLVPRMPVHLRDWLDAMQPQGELASVGVLWSNAGRFQLQGQMHDVGWNPHHGLPGVRGISGQLDGDAEAVRLQLDPGRWEVDTAGVFREPFQPRVAGEIVAFHPEGEWRIETPGLSLVEPDYDILVAGGAAFPASGGALLDLRADVADAPIVVAKRFWPVAVMPEPVVEWLDTALVDGRVAHGTALVRGNVHDWPFRHGEGRFEALAELAGAHLRYHREWPDGHDIAGSARFVNAGMEVDLDGRVGNAGVSLARGGIPDFHDAILQLAVRGSGSGKALLDVLRESSLEARYGAYLDGLSLGGRGTLAFDLRVPLGEDLGEPSVEGHVDIVRMDMHDDVWGLGFQSASGRVRFSDRGFSADELNVGFADTLATLNIAVGDYTSDSADLAEASLRGRFDAAALAGSNERSRWLRPWFAGESDWNLQLTVPREQTDAEAKPVLRIRSDLLGTAITLPAPLRKAREERLALDLRLGLPLEASSLDLALGRLLRLHGRVDDASGFNGFAVFGDVPDPGVPEHGLRLAGQIPVLDAAAWGSAIGNTAGASDLELESADLFAGELNLLGRRFRETGVRMRRSAEQIELGLSGAALEGSVLLPLDGIGHKGVTARFQRLVWPVSDDVDAMDASAASGSFAPASVPPLHLESVDTRFGDARLGSVWLETWPTASGMHIERFDAHSDALDLKAKGDWELLGAAERTSVNLDFSSHDAGNLLESLGFSRLIAGGSTHGQLQLTWPGAPGAFDWGGADGKLEFGIEQGRVLEVDPGAGRIFGLLNLTEIPRRLALDFSDFFKSGFAFNRMAGAFDIHKGDAVTDAFRIDAPSATIRISGRTGLKARDYDQTMEVLPKAGSVLPALGAIAAGPAGAAVGAVAQAVLRQPLQEMTRATYRVTGSWIEPKIELVERDSRRASAKP